MNLAVGLCASTVVRYPQVPHSPVGLRSLVILVTIKVIGLGYSAETKTDAKQQTVARSDFMLLYLLLSILCGK